MKLTHSKKKFSHRFSGLSVWIEPDPDKSPQLIGEMEYLRTWCGGIEAGQHDFVPHCTLLYNTSLDECGNNITTRITTTTRQQQGEFLLRQCYEEYRKQTTVLTSSEIHQNDMLQLIPDSHFYFPYPKTADSGRGFGCCISLIILRTTPQLQVLHDIVRKSFPPDERHGDNKDDEEMEKQEPRFRPHMALVYAPEDHENVVNGWLKKYTEQSEQEKRYTKWIPVEQDRTNKSEVSIGWNAKYLSLWSTNGTVDEWYPIVKLDLDEV